MNSTDREWERIANAIEHFEKYEVYDLTDKDVIIKSDDEFFGATFVECMKRLGYEFRSCSMWYMGQDKFLASIFIKSEVKK